MHVNLTYLMPYIDMLYICGSDYWSKKLYLPGRRYD